MSWRFLAIPNRTAELNLDNTLFTGQVFNFRKVGDTYVGTIRERVVELQHADDGLHYRLTPDSEEAEVLLHDYFNLSYRLSECYPRWASDSAFATLSARHPGVRILNQPPFECLVAFITS